MSRLERALLCAAAVALGHAPAAAQLVGHPIEVSGGVGYFSADVRSGMKDAPAYTGGIAWRVMPRLAVEGQAGFSTSGSREYRIDSPELPPAGGRPPLAPPPPRGPPGGLH